MEPAQCLEQAQPLLDWGWLLSLSLVKLCLPIVFSSGGGNGLSSLWTTLGVGALPSGLGEGDDEEDGLEDEQHERDQCRGRVDVELDARGSEGRR